MVPLVLAVKGTLVVPLLVPVLGELAVVAALEQSEPTGQAQLAGPVALERQRLSLALRHRVHMSQDHTR
jgi:hypothetical protein